MLTKLTLLLLPFLNLVQSDPFTSIRELDNLFDVEQLLVKSMNSYMKHATFETEIIELHYKELSKIEAEIKDTEKYAENPINAYSVIKRMHYDWPKIFRLMSSSPFFTEEPKYPDKSEVTSAVARIVEWQTEKKLETSRLARGLYKGIMPHANLTAFDCLEVAKYCYNKDKRLAGQWLQEALAKMEEGGGDSAKLLVQILEYTFLAKCLSDDLKGSVSAFQSLITDGADWYKPSATLKNDYELEKVKKCKATAITTLKKNKAKESSLFARHDWSTELCHATRRSTKLDESECYTAVVWSMARFLKIESITDQIQLLHDFVPNRLISDIKQSALEEFKTLKTNGLNGPVHLSNRELATVLDNHVNVNLGLSLDLLDGDQRVYIHAPGGKLASLKPSRHQEPEIKIGTLFYFMSDVVQGGNIVFPKQKVSIEPKKGSLLFWIDEENEIEVKECPVVVGSKWTMTQSIIDHTV